MNKRVLVNPGAKGASSTRVTDTHKLRIIAHTIMLSESLFSDENRVSESVIEYLLKRFGLKATADNVNKVKAFLGRNKSGGQ